MFFVAKMILFEIIVVTNLFVLVSAWRINGVNRMNAPKHDSLGEGALRKTMDMPLPDHQTEGEFTTQERLDSLERRVSNSLDIMFKFVESATIFCQSAETSITHLKKNKETRTITFRSAFRFPPELAYAVIKSRNMDTGEGFDLHLKDLKATHADLEVTLGGTGSGNWNDEMMIRWMACGKAAQRG